MKKKILIIIAAAVGFGNYIQAQSIPNGSFEAWTSTPYDELTGWMTANDQTIQQKGIATVTKVTGVTGSAIKLETKISGSDTLGAYFSNSFGDPINGEGGVPYSQKPSNITGKYMANMVGSDSAVLLIIFKKSGTIIGMNAFTLGGKSQTTFSSFNFPVMCTVVPDSVVIAGASSNLISNVGVAVGSSIVFDDFVFTGTGVTQAIPNGNFDTWLAKSLDIIGGGWKSYGRGVIKSTDFYKGSYAVRLETTLEQGQVRSSGISTGNIGGGGGPSGGFPFTNQSDTLFGYYKYSSTAADTGFVSAGLTKNGSPIGGNMVYLTTKSVYTYFEIPISAMTAPDSIRIDAGVSMKGTSAGSVLILDEIQLKSQKLNTGLLSAKYEPQAVSFYPNPVSNVLNIEHDLIKNNNSRLLIIDITGKVILSEKHYAGEQISLNTQNLNPGIYFYILEVNSGETLKGKFVKE